MILHPAWLRETKFSLTSLIVILDLLSSPSSVTLTGVSFLPFI